MIDNRINLEDRELKFLDAVSDLVRELAVSNQNNRVILHKQIDAIATIKRIEDKLDLIHENTIKEENIDG